MWRTTEGTVVTAAVPPAAATAAVVDGAGVNVGGQPSSGRRDGDDDKDGCEDGLRFFDPVGVGVAATTAPTTDRESPWQETPGAATTPTADGAIAVEATARPAVGAVADVTAAAPQPSAINETAVPSLLRPAPSAGPEDAARSQPLPYRATRRTTRVAGLSPPPSPPSSVLTLPVGLVAEPPRATAKRACLGVAGAEVASATAAATPAATAAAAAATAVASDARVVSEL